MVPHPSGCVSKMNYLNFGFDGFFLLKIKKRYEFVTNSLEVHMYYGLTKNEINNRG